MRYLVDFRYLVPPFLSLCLVILLSQDKPGPRAQVILTFDILYHPLFLIFHAALTLLFLLISVKLPFTLTLERIRLRVGDFSLPLTVSMLASVIFPPTLFWVVFPILIVTSPWFRMVLDMFKSFLRWLYHTLQYIPILIIGCTFQCQKELDAAPAQVEIGLVEIEGFNE
ncbi:hypothetical protein I3760_11G082700 [Carya illinoinensis]|uniref:Uncharacterized protein n=1 Tax=Carya illinoinensis TaxID=32201 RepID=A0A922DNC7_CARIL|nr:hypothetical protein I3760_11G082700 [Carya illinoinensis]KAG6687659.1 hypothetical protein I3842_11G083800 [Carya illinoinensis]